MAAGDLYQYTVETKVNDQHCLTVFGLRESQPSALGYVGQMNTLNAAEDGGGAGTIRTLLTQCLAANAEIIGYTAQKVSPTRQMKVSLPVSRFGLQGAVCTFQNVSAVITRRGLVADKRSISTLHMPGLPDDQAFQGEIVPGFKVVMNLLCNKLITNWGPYVDGSEYENVIINRLGPGILASRLIVQATPQVTVRTMRRRTVGIGI